MTGTPITTEQITVCSDCMWVWSGHETTPEHAERFEERTCYIHDIDPDTEHFSWSPCELCKSTLGGDRYTAHVRYYKQ
jgi:hypothetical protein